MKSSSHFPNTKFFRCRAVGTLLLVIPLCGITSQFAVTQAQPKTTPPTTVNLIGPDQKATAKNIMAVARRQRALKTPVDLQVENASLADVVARLQKLVPKGTELIDVRTKGEVRVSFDLKQTRVGDILTNVAGLAGNKVYVLSEGIVLTDSSALTPPQMIDIRAQRGGEWSQSREAGGSGWSNMTDGNDILSLAVAREVMGKGDEAFPTGVVNTTFDKFSPESQEMLQELAFYFNGRAPKTVSPIQLNAASLVTVEMTVESSNSRSVSVSFPPDASHPGEPTKGVGTTFVNNP